MMGDLNTTKSGPSAAHQWNAMKWYFSVGWRWPNIEFWLGSFVIFLGIRTTINKESNSFVIFQGGAYLRMWNPNLSKCIYCMVK